MLLARRLPRFFARLDQLSQIIAAVDAVANRTHEQVFLAERALIQIQIEWEHFVRNLILDSATSKFENASGLITSRSYPRLRTREAAAHVLIGTYPRQPHEPDWYLPVRAIDAAIRLDVSNHSQIGAELGLTPWPIDELRHLRNFIAHKSKRSALKVRATGFVGASASIEALQIALQFGAGGAKRYVEWINFSKGVASRLVI